MGKTNSLHEKVNYSRLYTRPKIVSDAVSLYISLKTVLETLEMTYSLPVQPVVLPSGSEDLAAFARMSNNASTLGNAGHSGGGLFASPYPAR